MSVFGNRTLKSLSVILVLFLCAFATFHWSGTEKTRITLTQNAVPSIVTQHQVPIGNPPFSPQHQAPNINPPPVHQALNINPPPVHQAPKINPPPVHQAPNINPPPVYQAPNINPPFVHQAPNINPPPVHQAPNINPPSVPQKLNPLPPSVQIQNTPTAIASQPTKVVNNTGAIPTIPTDVVLRSMDHRALAQQYHDYVNSIQIACIKSVRHGNVGDGGWDVCEDYPFTVKRPCLVYSFGISNEWSFDDSITRKYGCVLHAYDPSMKTRDHDRSPILHFHATGLNNTDATNTMGWRMRTFGALLKENGHSQSTIDVLKIDIEHSEWLAFPEMLASGSLDRVRQFCFEIHMKLKHQPEASPEKYIRGLKLFKDLYNAGFRIFKTHKNMDAKYISKFGGLRTGCHEIYMVQTNITKLKV